MNLEIFPQNGLLAFSLFVCLVVGLLRNYYSKSIVTTKSSELYLFSAGNSILCALFIFVMSGCKLEWSKYTIIMSVIFGFVTMLQNIAVTKALTVGPFSYTTVIGSAGTMISALSGYFFFNEDLTPLKVIGMAFMLICFALSVKKDENEKKATFIWFLLALAGAITTGLIGVLQKVHQSSEHKGELMAFLVIAFLFSYIFSQIFFVFAKKSEQKEMAETGIKPKSSGKSKMFVFWIIFISALCVAFNNVINLYLSGVMESAVFFPIVNGGGLILSILFCMIIFKEKLQPQQWVGVAAGVVATLILGMP